MSYCLPKILNIYLIKNHINNYFIRENSFFNFSLSQWEQRSSGENTVVGKATSESSEADLKYIKPG